MSLTVALLAVISVVTFVNDVPSRWHRWRDIPCPWVHAPLSSTAAESHCIALWTTPNSQPTSSSYASVLPSLPRTAITTSTLVTVNHEITRRIIADPLMHTVCASRPRKFINHAGKCPRTVMDHKIYSVANH